PCRISTSTLPRAGAASQQGGTMGVRAIFCGVFVCVALLGLAAAGGAAGSDRHQADSPKHADDPAANVHHDVSPPLSSIAPVALPSDGKKKEKEPKKGPPVPA